MQDTSGFRRLNRLLASYDRDIVTTNPAMHLYA